MFLERTVEPRIFLAIDGVFLKNPPSFKRGSVKIPGKDGDDVPLYLEKQLAKLLAELKKLGEDKDL